jgi:23S rRNA U2552 (ribose-2'-O)-methylase RlmE/FtsJ
MFSMMEWAASQLDEATGAFTLDPDNNNNGDVPAVLDLALAPGGFSSYILSRNPDCEVDGFTLPEEDGGHEVLVDCDPERLSITTTDMTNFMGELGVEPGEIPEGHPDAEALLNAEWPYSRERYNLVIADGKPPTKTDDTQKPFRDVGCALRATQIALALSKVRPGGTIVMLCFNSRRPRAFRLLYELNNISESLQLFKPEPMHAVKSSFYVVCRGVRTESPECKELIARYVNSWRRAVFYPSPSESEHPDGSEGDDDEQEQEKEPGHQQRPKAAAPGSEDGNGYSSVDGDGDGDSAVDVGPVGDPWLPPMDIAKLIDEFGETYVALARPIWDVQIRGMRRTWSKLEGLRNKDEKYRHKAVSSNTDWKPKRLNVGGGSGSWGGYSKNGRDHDDYNLSLPPSV